MARKHASPTKMDWEKKSSAPFFPPPSESIKPDRFLEPFLANGVSMKSSRRRNEKVFFVTDKRQLLLCALQLQSRAVRSMSFCAVEVFFCGSTTRWFIGFKRQQYSALWISSYYYYTSINVCIVNAMYAFANLKGVFERISNDLYLLLLNIAVL